MEDGGGLRLDSSHAQALTKVTISVNSAANSGGGLVAADVNGTYRAAETIPIQSRAGAVQHASAFNDLFVEPRMVRVCR